jgi:hypothetical protein
MGTCTQRDVTLGEQKLPIGYCQEPGVLVENVVALAAMSRLARGVTLANKARIMEQLLVGIGSWACRLPVSGVSKHITRRSQSPVLTDWMTGEYPQTIKASVMKWWISRPRTWG